MLKQRVQPRPVPAVLWPRRGFPHCLLIVAPICPDGGASPGNDSGLHAMAPPSPRGGVRHGIPTLIACVLF